MGSDADQVLRDALEILSSPEIKLSQLKRKSGFAEEEEDDVEGPAAAMEKAKTKIITKVGTNVSGGQRRVFFVACENEYCGEYHSCAGFAETRGKLC